MKTTLFFTLFLFFLIGCTNKENNSDNKNVSQTTVVDLQTPIDSIFFSKLSMLLENKGTHYSFNNEPRITHYQLLFNDFALISNKEDGGLKVIYILDMKDRLNLICELRPSGLYTTEKQKVRSRKIVVGLKKITACIHIQAVSLFYQF